MTWYVGDNSTNNGSFGMVFESVHIINVSNLVLTLQQKIDSSTNERDLLYYSKAIQQLRTGNVFVVNNITELPSAENNLGSLYYVSYDESVYFSSTLGWAQLYLNTSTALFTWGSNTCGRLGNGTLTCTCSPVREFYSATNWCQVSAGCCFTSSVKSNGEIWGWGVNSCGNLGDGTTVDKCSPVRELCYGTDWCQVSVGLVHTSALKNSGELWGWGRNPFSSIGDGTVTTKCSPVREICSATNWCQVSTNHSLHTAAIKTSGELWAWGLNTCGRLGDGTITQRCSPVREFCSATNWCQVSAGSLHTAAVKTSGELWGWGLNNPGAIGDGTITTRCSPVREICSATGWCQVSTGICNTAAVKTSGELWVWGLNFCGKLGDGTATNRCSPVREFCSATDWCQVSTNTGSVAVKTSGELWAWGRNLCGSVGDGTTVNKCSPVREICSATNWCQVCAGYNHTFAIKTSGQLWAWGNNSCGKLGDGTTIDKCSPVREVSSSSDWCQVSVGRYHTMAIKAIACICR